MFDRQLSIYQVLQLILIRYILCLSDNSQEGETDERENYYSWHSW